MWASIPSELAAELVVSTQAKTDCKEWHTDGWSGYERVLPDEVEHYISTRVNASVVSELMGLYVNKRSRWHRRQNKWEQALGTNSDGCAVSRKLLQLDLAAFMLRNEGGVGVLSLATRPWTITLPWYLSPRKIRTEVYKLFFNLYGKKNYKRICGKDSSGIGYQSLQRQKTRRKRELYSGIRSKKRFVEKNRQPTDQ